MDQPGPSSRNVLPETTESPIEPNASEVSVTKIPRVGLEIPLGIGLESSSEVEYEEPLSYEENVNNDDDSKDGPVNEEPPVDYGFEDDFIGDSHFILYSRHDIILLRGWRAFVLERSNCPGFIVPEPPILERLILVLRVISGVNWQRSVLSGSGELKIEQLSAAITGFSITTHRERRDFVRLFGVWAKADFLAGFRGLASRGGFLDLD